MKITSPNFTNNGDIPSIYTCDGGDIRPDLQIANVPAEAKSLAIILHDPDAPSGEFIHWTAWNIDPGMTDIAGADPLPGATQGPNGTGQPGYKGPCPPTGTHHYIFTVYAVSDVLTLPASATANDLRTALKGHIIEQATVTGLYARSNAGASSSTASAMPDTAPGATVTPE